MLAIALRTARELGYNISESYINKAEQAYRDFYDSKRKHLLFDRNYPDIISFVRPRTGIFLALVIQQAHPDRQHGNQ